jgi:hypothetical protein
MAGLLTKTTLSEIMDKINQILDSLAVDEIFVETEQQYEEFMDTLFAEYDMQMYAANSYDLDAYHFGIE